MAEYIDLRKTWETVVAGWPEAKRQRHAALADENEAKDWNRPAAEFLAYLWILERDREGANTC
jgi:hypothetical protein